MTIMLLERVRASVRGDLSRWLIEVSTGVFVGHVSALVRDALWERCTRHAEEGTVLQLWSTNNEQGFDLRYHQPKGRIPVQMEGIWLIQEIKPNPRFKP
jgi:CRISPR-associated protein Cas2